MSGANDHDPNYSSDPEIRAVALDRTLRNLESLVEDYAQAVQSFSDWMIAYRARERARGFRHVEHRRT